MRWLSDNKIKHLLNVVDRPDFSSTKYTIVREIARGGMGTVYLAKDEELGMTPAVLAAIRPHLTLFGPAQPNPLNADPIVTATVSQIQAVSQVAVPANQAPENPVIVRMTASGLGPSNARVQRSAIIRVGAALPGGYAVLAWGSGFD